MEINSVSKEQAEANKLLAWLVEECKKETPEEAKERRKTVCETCDYWGDGDMCDYFLRERKIKPCTGRECVKKGYYKPAEKKKKRENAWGK